MRQKENDKANGTNCNQLLNMANGYMGASHATLMHFLKV